MIDLPERIGEKLKIHRTNCGTCIFCTTWSHLYPCSACSNLNSKHSHSHWIPDVERGLALYLKEER